MNKKLYIVLILILTIAFSTKAIANLTLGTTSINSDSSLNLTTTGGLTVSGGTLSLGANNLSMTGSLGATGARLTKGWFTDLESTNPIIGSITGNAITATTAMNLSGGLGGQIPYQSAAGTTAMLLNGTAGQVLQSNGTTLAPSWTTIAGGGITNGAGANVIPKSDGTNLVASQITDNGSSISLNSATLYGIALNLDNGVGYYFGAQNAPVGIGDPLNYGNGTQLLITDSTKTITAIAGTESIAIDGVGHIVTLQSASDTSIIAGDNVYISSNGQHIGLNAGSNIVDISGPDNHVDINGVDLINLLSPRITNTAATSISNVTPLWGTGNNGTEFQVNGNGSFSASSGFFSVNTGGAINNYGGGGLSNGQLLIWDDGETAFIAHALTPGTGITITNGPGSITIAQDPSDANLKNILSPFTDGLDSILKITPQTFTWKDNRHPGLQAGLIAQDVQQAIPLAVSENADGILQLNDRALTAALINSVKELNTKVEAQQVEIDQLKKQLRGK